MTLRHKKPWEDDEYGEERWSRPGYHRPEGGWPYARVPPRPPWMHHHPRRAELRHWRRSFRHRGGPLFFRFVGAFGFIVLLVLGGMAALAFLFTRAFGGGGQTAALVWIGGILLALGMPFLAVTLALEAFRRIAVPLADLMMAAEAVAQGDLSTRVEVKDRGEFDQLARAFNHMVEELEQADQRRRNLTADVAHELRTPLHIIQGNLEGVLDDVYRPTPEHITATLEETRALARLVEDLRTLSLAEAGQLALEWEPVDVVELLADVHTSFSGQAEAAGIDLHLDRAPVPPGGDDADRPALTVTGDVGRLDQVLSNLVANAIRHTPAGGTIALGADTVPGGVRITVRDTGEGIPAEDLPYIFDRFWKGDRSRSRARGAGSGLGLAIARQLIHAHRGRIDVESHVGRGTTFTIFLPTRP